MPAVPHIVFYFNVHKLSDSLFACTFAHYRMRKRLSLLCINDEQRQAIDRLLWIHPQYFLPHVYHDAPLAEDTPVILDLAPHTTPADLCLNLAKHRFSSASIPYTHVIEFVTEDTTERAAARQRYRHWQTLGCPIQTYDVSQITDWNAALPTVDSSEENSL